MKILSLTAIAVSGLGVILAGGAAGAARTNVTIPAARSAFRPALSRPATRPRKNAAPTPCSTPYQGGSSGQRWFLGIAASTEGNVAGGNDAAVLGGFDNTSCDYDDAIAGGLHNTMGDGAGHGAASFIGAGQSNAVYSSTSIVGAGSSNTVSAMDSAITAGSSNAITAYAGFVGAGDHNSVTGAEGAIAGGTSNVAQGPQAFVGAGYANAANGTYAGISAGIDATVAGSGSFIGGGGYLQETQCDCATYGNVIGGADSAIGAGDGNNVGASESFVGSGFLNVVQAPAQYSSILGGARNNVSGEYASVLGGFGNSAAGSYAIVAGGDADSAAGTLTFAAGYHAHAAHDGSFVWSDYVSGSTAVTDTATNQFVVRASGGTTIYSNEAQTAGVKLAAGSGTWSSLSDRNVKTGFVNLDDATILAKVATLPIRAWQYRTESGVRHIGPMAQDFYAAFGAGEDDRHIASIDEDGVALSAIKALDAKNARLEARLAASERQNAALARRVDDLARTIAR